MNVGYSVCLSVCLQDQSVKICFQSEWKQQRCSSHPLQPITELRPSHQVTVATNHRSSALFSLTKDLWSNQKAACLAICPPCPSDDLSVLVAPLRSLVLVCLVLQTFSPEEAPDCLLVPVLLPRYCVATETMQYSCTVG